MTGAAIVIKNAAATDTILSVKRRVFAVNREMPVRRQRLMYRPGPFGLKQLADDETLGGAGVARDGTAELDVLLADLTDAEIAAQSAPAIRPHDDFAQPPEVCCTKRVLPVPLFRAFESEYSRLMLSSQCPIRQILEVIMRDYQYVRHLGTGSYGSGADLVRQYLKYSTK